MHIYQTKIKLHETDAAGVIFYSNQFKIIHDAYESMLEGLGFSFADIIRKKDFMIPIVHTESDYKSPLFVGDPIEIQTNVTRVGKTSFTLAYTLLNASQEIVGTAKTVHVTMDKKSRKKIPLPPDFRIKLEDFLESRAEKTTA